MRAVGAEVDIGHDQRLGIDLVIHRAREDQAELVGIDVRGVQHLSRPGSPPVRARSLCWVRTATSAFTAHAKTTSDSARNIRDIPPIIVENEPVCQEDWSAVGGLLLREAAKRLARGRRGHYCGGVKLLFIADIVGQPGRRAVKELVPQLRQQHQLSLVVANGENSAGGSGITPNTAEEIFAAGVDIITSGDHLWDQKEVMGLLESERRFVRPLNYPPGTPGQGSTIFQAPGLPPVAS